MNRKTSVESRDRPSIIEEIVIYDKPNKPSFPQDIFPQPAVFEICKGDIVLSRTPKKSGSESTTARSPKDRRVKNEPSDVDEEVQDCESEEADEFESAGINIKTENEESRYEDDSSEVEESIENISREISKSNARPSKKVVESDNDDGPRKKQKSNLPFKKPRGRPRKQPQQNTILNFVIKQPKNIVDLKLIEQNGKSSQANESPTRGVRQKRTRRRPKKYDDAEILNEDSEQTTSDGSDSDEDPTFTAPLKKKKFTELTIVPLYDKGAPEEQVSNTDNLDTLLNETQEQVRALNDVELELQNLVEGDTSRQKTPGPKKSLDKGTKRASPGKAKKTGKQKPLAVANTIKQEAEEENDDLIDVPREEAYESDEDSRKEWVPEEYAEYKQQHILKLTNKMHKCKFCGCDFASYYSMRKHRALEHDDVGKDRLESTYETPEGAEEVEELEGESDEESRGEWMPEDYAQYKLKHNMNKMKRVQWYKCKICCAVFSNYYKLSKHRVEHENKPEPYECKQCRSKFKDVDSLTAHIRVHQGKDPYKCKKCDKGFKTKEELISHMPVHILKKPPPPQKRFRCDLCGKEFSKLCDIERHTRVHTGEKPCECNICHKRFQQSHNLSKHLLTHLHVKPFQCEICNKKFGRIDVLNRHLLTHSMEKPYKCELCSKGFIRQVQLGNHTEKFHPEMDVDDRGGRVTDEVTVTPLG